MYLILQIDFIDEVSVSQQPESGGTTKRYCFQSKRRANRTGSPTTRCNVCVCCAWMDNDAFEQQPRGSDTSFRQHYHIASH